MTSVILALVGLLFALAAWRAEAIPVGAGRMAAKAIAWRLAGLAASIRRRVATRPVPARLPD